MRFLIIATGWNCKEWVHDCIASVLRQKTKDWRLILTCDGSTDGTHLEIDYHVRNLRDKRITGVIGVRNEGAAKRRFEAIHKYGEDGDVVVLLGMDDRLMPDALELIEAEYNNGKMMTYGNWMDDNGFVFPSVDLYFPEEVHRDRSYRSVKYRSTAPNTFKIELYSEIPMDDFKIDGEWIKQTTESEVMFSCLEMCGKDRIGVITKPIYFYRQRGKMSAKKRLGSVNQLAIYNEIIKRPKRGLYEGC